jgi:hypothetical protein
VPQIPAKVLEPHERARVAMQVFCEGRAPHRPSCGETCIGWRQAATELLLFQHREMRLHLARQFALGGLAAKDVQQPAKETSHRVDQAAPKACLYRSA